LHDLTNPNQNPRQTNHGKAGTIPYYNHGDNTMNVEQAIKTNSISKSRFFMNVGLKENTQLAIKNRCNNPSDYIGHPYIGAVFVPVGEEIPLDSKYFVPRYCWAEPVYKVVKDSPNYMECEIELIGHVVEYTDENLETELKKQQPKTVGVDPHFFAADYV